MSAENTSRVGEERDDGKQPKREIILAFIEYASRPLATVFIGLFVVLWLFFMRGALFQLLANTESVKIGSFNLAIFAQPHEKVNSRLGVNRKFRDRGPITLSGQGTTDSPHASLRKRMS